MISPNLIPDRVLHCTRFSLVVKAVLPPEIAHKDKVREKKSQSTIKLHCGVIHAVRKYWALGAACGGRGPFALIFIMLQSCTEGTGYGWS
jgi:hypothetical protein